jgi:dolichol-phosphate mannosyltransferase
VTYLALFTAGLSALAIVGYVVFSFFKPDAPKGFLTLLVALFFLGSIQLTTMAILGDYLGRIFEEVKQRPRFIVKEVLNPPAARSEGAGNRPPSRER